jgi:hypothetical protein
MYNDTTFNSSALNLELLLGNQGWRQGKFFFGNLLDLTSIITNMSDTNLNLLE